MEMLKKLLEKKLAKDGPMDPKKKQAKMDMLSELQDEAKRMMADDLKAHMVGGEASDLDEEHGVDGPSHEMKKVSVMSDDKAGLEKGLDKAKELLSKMPEEEESAEEESHESPEEEESEGHMSSDEIQAEIDRLMAQKKKARK